MTLSLLLVLAVVFLALSNGANDNFKGVASLLGSRTVGYRVALAWATATTAAGSLAAIVLAEALLKRFKGKGLVPDAVMPAGRSCWPSASAPPAPCCSRRPRPAVSTTHAMTGALVGAGLDGGGSAVQLGALGKTVVLPLLLSPVLAVALGAGVYARAEGRTGGDGRDARRGSCVCVVETPALAISAGGALALRATRPAMQLKVAHAADCEGRYAARVFGISGQRLRRRRALHQRGVVSFARGLNDTPKIAAVLLAAPSSDQRPASSRWPRRSPSAGSSAPGGSPRR